MSKYGPDIWKQHNKQLEALLSRFVIIFCFNVLCFMLSIYVFMLIDHDSDVQYFGLSPSIV